MRTASIVTFASVILSLLAACAGTGDVGLRAPAEGNGPTVAVVGTAAAPGGTTPSGTSVPTAFSPDSATPSIGVLEPTPNSTSQSSSPAGDGYTFDPALWQADLAPLGSFRQKAVLDFTAAESGVRSKVTFEGEATVDPSAFHSVVRVEGQGAAQLPTNQVEVTWINEEVWVKVGLQPWVLVPATAVSSQYSGQVVGVAELLPFIRGAERAVPDELVNGIPARHYVYGLDNLQPTLGMTSARGDLWVARDGGYVVRLTLEGQGTYHDTYTASGTLRLVYDLYDVDVPLTISPPR